MEKYFNRQVAGNILAHELKEYANRSDVIILALPRGGVPVAYEIAKTLNAPLDVYIVRKLGVPQQEELAFGAMAMDGSIVYNEEVLKEIPLPKPAIEAVINTEKQELDRRIKGYRGNRPPLQLTNKTVILVDDGIATGATMKAAVQAIRQQNPASIIVAVPVAALSSCNEMAELADKVVCPLMPEFFYAVGAWYEDFSQTSDEEVINLLNH